MRCPRFLLGCFVALSCVCIAAAALRLEAVAPVLDRLGDFRSLSIRGCVLQVTGLRASAGNM
jgi:hypothetical protein